MKPLVFAVLALFAFMGMARAEEGDSSPDKDFFGFWRVIEAMPGPWAPARTLKAGDAPLLGWMLSFEDGEIKGPPALGCKPARYIGSQTAIGDVFDRRLDRDNYVEQGSVLGFMAAAETERVVCGGGTGFDYYLSHRGDLLIAVGDVIYRLRHPDGDPSTFKAGYSGPGFDCIVAVNAAQRTICGDLKLSGFDRVMTEGYKRLEAGETAASFATVRGAQMAWVESVTRRCQADGPLPDHSADVVAIRDCLADDYAERAALFEGARAVKSSGLALEPRMRFTARKKPLFFDSDVYPWLTGGAAASAFNAHVAEVLALDQQRVDAGKLFAPANMPANVALSAKRGYAVARFDGRIVSVQIRTDDFTGGTHDQLNEFSINWDLAKGAPIGFADLFPFDKDGLQFATDFAVKDLVRQFGTEPPPAPDDVAHIVADPNNWRFTSDAAIVHFPVYSIADFSKGAFDVAIPYTALKDYLMPNTAVTAVR